MRKPNNGIPCVQLNVSISEPLLDEVKKVIRFYNGGRLPYGTVSAIVETLLKKWVEGNKNG